MSDLCPNVLLSAIYSVGRPPFASHSAKKEVENKIHVLSTGGLQTFYLWTTLNGPTGTLNSFLTSPPCVSGDKSFDINTNISDQEMPQKEFFIVWCKPAWTSLCQWIGVDVQSQIQVSLRKPTWRRLFCSGPLVIWRLILGLLFGSSNWSLGVTIFSDFLYGRDYIQRYQLAKYLNKITFLLNQPPGTRMAPQVLSGHTIHISTLGHIFPISYFCSTFFLHFYKYAFYIQFQLLASDLNKCQTFSKCPSVSYKFSCQAWISLTLCKKEVETNIHVVSSRWMQTYYLWTTLADKKKPITTINNCPPFHLPTFPSPYPLC